jgi:hypothetical protein
MGKCDKIKVCCETEIQLLRTDDTCTFLNFRSFFMKTCLQLHLHLHCILFSPKNWRYPTRSSLELGILIIPGCCKKMVNVYQYVVMAKMFFLSMPRIEPLTTDMAVRCTDHYAIGDHDLYCVKSI